MNIDLTDLDAVMASMDEIVAEKGLDYVYPVLDPEWADGGPLCHYVRDDAPSCIIGHFVVKHQIFSLDKLSNELEGKTAGDLLNRLSEQSVGVGRQVRKFLTTVQCKQDAGTCWGEAVETARFEALELGSGIIL